MIQAIFMLLQEIPTLFDEFLNRFGSMTILGREIPYLGILLLLVSAGLLITVMYFIRRSIKNRVKYLGVAPDLINALQFFMNIIFAVLFVWLILTFLEIEKEYVLLVSGVVATAIAFASMKTMNNFIAGVWIAFTQPFVVGDYINIDDVEGIVVDIVLNYTKIKHKDQNVTMIPNLQCLTSNIINFTISLPEYENKIEQLNKYLQTLMKGGKKKSEKDQKLIAKLQTEMAENEWIVQQINKLYNEMDKAEDIVEEKQKNGEEAPDLLTLDKFSEFARDERFVRYCFRLNLRKDLKKNEDALNVICDNWKKVFHLRPTWELVGISSHFQYQVTILTPDPENILNHYDAFITDVYSRIR